jgi:hypothetical protein
MDFQVIRQEAPHSSRAGHNKINNLKKYLLLLQHRFNNSSKSKMETRQEFWSDRYTLNLPPQVSLDKSELDYLRRTNREAAEAAAALKRPALREARMSFGSVERKLPLIITHPPSIAWSAEVLGESTTPNSPIEPDETPVINVNCPTPIIDSMAEERRDSGIDMEDDEIEVDTQETTSNPDPNTDPCGEIRRDSGIEMDEENQEPESAAVRSPKMMSRKKMLMMEYNARCERVAAFEQELDDVFGIDLHFHRLSVGE